MPRGRMPWGALGFVAIVAAVELTIQAHHVWFADLPAQEWEAKDQLIANRQLAGNVVVVGSSILFHALDTRPANHELAGRAKVVNLALSGQTLQHSTQILEHYFRSRPPVDLVVLELWNMEVKHKSWLGGPYYRSWASWNEFLQSRVQYWEPSSLVGFAANRLLPSFRYREDLDNWIFSCLHLRGLADGTLRRNRAIAEQMRDQLGFVPAGEFDAAVLPAGHHDAGETRPWWIDASADVWLKRFVRLCARHRVKVALLLPPTPPFIATARARGDFLRGCREYVAALRESNPGLSLDLVQFDGYERADFCDDHHFNLHGRQRLTHDFARWIGGYYPVVVSRKDRLTTRSETR